MSREDWDETYRDLGARWGYGPSEVALVAEQRLGKLGRRGPMLRLLDLGCGYGRDSFYLHERLGASVLGVDSSAEAIARAERRRVELAHRSEVHAHGVRFVQAALEDLDAGPFDALVTGGLYHLLDPSGREALARCVRRHLRTGGLLFLSTLSTADPEHYGRGVAVVDELDSFVDAVYLHFAREAELRSTFSFMDLRELYEHEYVEAQAAGRMHHHVSWILVAAA